MDNYEEKLRSKFIYLGVFEDLQTSIDKLAKIVGKPSTKLPHFNVSTYDEKIPHHLREKFYEDYPLLKRVYDLAVRTYKLDGYQFPAGGGPAIAPESNLLEMNPAKPAQPHTVRAVAG